MKYLQEIRTYRTDPLGLEILYERAQQGGESSEFAEDLRACYQEDSENNLLAAWDYRLQKLIIPLKAKSEERTNWLLAVPLAIITGLVFWGISFEQFIFVAQIPYLYVYWTPIATVFILLFLVFTNRRSYWRAVAIILGLIAVSIYVLLLVPGQSKNYQGHSGLIMVLHLPLISWAAVGIVVLGLRSKFRERFAFLIKSLEVFITGGLYLAAGVAFGVITVGLFSAISIELPDTIIRLIAAGGAGLLPIIAVTSIYNPLLNPGEQDFRQGLSRFIAQMMRLLLPLTLGVLAVYILIIPFNFLEPFKNRDLLIVYNLMLFAVMSLLLGVTPIRLEDLTPRVQLYLRRGILAVAILAVVVSLYAMSATVYRTVQGGITINRLTIIGWNTINIAILGLLIFRQFRLRSNHWVESLQSVFSLATVGYVCWSLFLILLIPLLFR